MAEPLPCARCGARSWVSEPGEPMKCSSCGETWPGVPLPTSPNEAAGWGELAEQASWTQRVLAMRSELSELPDVDAGPHGRPTQEVAGT